jgi:uncharacterized oxidoreductase
MKLNGQTILMTGGGSGIGLALAVEFKNLGNEVIVAGRSESKLAHARSLGLQTLTVDLSDSSSVTSLAENAVAKFPKLNVVIHMAGIMKNENLRKHSDPAIISETVATNLLAPLQLTQSLLPHLLKQSEATVMTVTSGLAFAALSLTPTYSATKAAIHSYTEALRYQLRETNVKVIELVPPYVRTSLMGHRQASDPNAMPLEEFVSEVMKLLRENPNAPEILVERVKPQRMAGDINLEKYRAFFTQLNDRMYQARKAEFEAE